MQERAGIPINRTNIFRLVLPKVGPKDRAEFAVAWGVEEGGDVGGGHRVAGEEPSVSTLSRNSRYPFEKKRKKHGRMETPAEAQRATFPRS